MEKFESGIFEKRIGLYLYICIFIYKIRVEVNYKLFILRKKKCQCCRNLSTSKHKHTHTFSLARIHLDSNFKATLFIPTPIPFEKLLLYSKQQAHLIKNNRKDSKRRELRFEKIVEDKFQRQKNSQKNETQISSKTNKSSIAWNIDR